MDSGAYHNYAGSFKLWKVYGIACLSFQIKRVLPEVKHKEIISPLNLIFIAYDYKDMRKCIDGGGRAYW